MVVVCGEKLESSRSIVARHLLLCSPVQSTFLTLVLLCCPLSFCLPTLLSPHSYLPPPAAACVSAPVYPLRSRAPATGAKPFTIAAAWRSAPATGGGLIRAVLSCLTDTAAAGATGGAGCQHQHRHGHSSWVCEVWLVTLSSQELVATAGANQQQPQLQVLGCQLLHVSRAPPAAAVACAGADKVLLLSEPGLEEGELPPGRFVCLCFFVLCGIIVGVG